MAATDGSRPGLVTMINPLRSITDRISPGHIPHLSRFKSIRLANSIEESG
jgi:hypothetical protein